MIKHLHILAPELKRTIALSAAVLVTVGSLFAYPDFEEAKSGADQGDAQAQAVVATYYALGWQTAKDPALAARYAEQSAKAGNPLGKFRLGALLRNGEGVAKDEAAGLRLQNEAAGIWSKGFDENDPFALTAIGVALFQGKVVSQDKTKAAQLYKKAADMGFAPAQFNYAMCAKDGQGIPKDTALCTEYLSKAADSGYRLAQEALGQPATAVASNSAADSSEFEPQASAGPISGGLDLQFASTSPSTTPPTAPLVANAGPISGSFSLGGESSSASGSAATPNSTTKQLTVTGIGVDPAGAEKQAITDAVRQAVGALIDSNTLVQNEEVIRDRILSVSTGFVKEYKLTSPARKRDDGLYEITILATVATNEVAQKLKENNLISGEVAGQNLYAEATTKIMNVEDAVAMLQAKFPELIKSCVTITPLNEEGNPMMVKDPSGQLIPSTQPAFKSENAEKKEITLTWLLEIGADKKYYKETLLPLVKQCMDAIAGTPAKEATIPLEKILGQMDESRLRNQMDESRLRNRIPSGLGKYVKATGGKTNAFNDNRLFLIKSISKNFDRCEFFFYPDSKNMLIMKFISDTDGEVYSPCFITIELTDSDGEVIAFAKQDCWNPFYKKTDQYGGFSYLSISPLYGYQYLTKTGYLNLIDITIPIDQAKEIKNVRFSLGTNAPVFSLKTKEN